jgi:demethylmenaquinone methyltransferase/2-methoxy-6-polyprenyl-1,4-benzoquinol methylase
MFKCLTNSVIDETNGVSMNTDAYGKIAKWYDTLFEPLNAGLRAISMKMFPPGAGMFILDVGCGTGSQLALYQKAGCEVFGIDTSPAMLQVARRKLGNRANLHLGDASRMPYRAEMFELITTSLTLHEMPGAVRTAVMNETKRTLKKDGRILLIDFHPGSIRFPKGWLFKGIITVSEIAAGREHFKNYRDFMARNGLPALSAAHGLSVDKERIVSGGNLGLFLLRLE